MRSQVSTTSANAEVPQFNSLNLLRLTRALVALAMLAGTLGLATATATAQTETEDTVTCPSDTGTLAFTMSTPIASPTATFAAS